MKSWKSKRNEARWLWFWASLVGIYIAMHSGTILADSHFSFIEWYVIKWQPLSLDQFFMLLLLNLLFLVLGRLIASIGSAWMDKFVSNEPKNDNANTLGGPLTSFELGFPLLMLLLGPFLAGFLLLSLGLAGTFCWLYSMTKVHGDIVKGFIFSLIGLYVTYAICNYLIRSEKAKKRR